MTLTLFHKKIVFQKKSKATESNWPGIILLDVFMSREKAAEDSTIGTIEIFG